MSSKLLRGTFILTAGMMLSKVLGLLYVIPFDALVGEKGFGLYSYGYLPYTLFISIATGGLPLAVSKFVSKYNALGEYAVGQKLFKTSMKIMLLTGLLSFLLLFVLAQPLGEYYAANDHDYTANEIAQVIRAVSFALILVPIMSIIRGFFQGNQSMAPTAISQVVEQLVRIVFLLAGAFIVIKVMDGGIVNAISVATFAAFIGAIGGLAVLLVYWKQRKPYLDDLLLQDRGEVDISIGAMYKEILQSSIPFVFVGIAMTLFQLIDSFTLGKAMASIGKGKETVEALGILNISANKLVVIPMTFASAFAMSILPTVTKAFVEEKMTTFSSQLNQALQVLLFLTLPAVVGMSILAEPVYSAFYGYNELGVEVLKVYAPAAILFSLFSVSAAVLQGINQQKFSVLSLLVGILIKLSLNIPLIKLFQVEGSVYATTLGYLAATIINLYMIRYFTGFKYQLVVRRTLLMAIFTIAMTISVKIVFSLVSLGLDPTQRLQAIIVILLCALAGAAVYFFLALKSKLANRLFGDRIDKLQKKLKLRG
ncbi:putative polysaccharide biosynthesis protein [Peribacillus alkalitolerans]|uniref:putative polysaccharide biosynthesis protein n=1 Tax=Peribacillus alkalitolerans TaxID=1550385 RepID=UPI0013D20D12|nr:polysaccharide biosynthesis protein [Peribacillus alkalitolerans]